MPCLRGTVCPCFAGTIGVGNTTNTIAKENHTDGKKSHQKALVTFAPAEKGGPQLSASTMTGSLVNSSLLDCEVARRWHIDEHHLLVRDVRDEHASFRLARRVDQCWSAWTLDHLHPLDLVLDNVLRGFCHKLEHLQQPQLQRVLALVRRQLVNGGVNSCQPAVEFDPTHHLSQRACVAWGGQPHKRLAAPHASLGQNAVRTYRTACCFVRTNRLQVTVHRSCKNAHPKTPRPPAAAVIVPPKTHRPPAAAVIVPPKMHRPPQRP